MPDDNTWNNDVVKKFQRRKNEIEAIRIRDDNLHICAKWCGGKVLKRSTPPAPTSNSYFDRTTKSGEVAENEPVLIFPTLEGPIHAFLNEWLIKDEDGRFSLLAAKEFKYEYAVPTPPYTTEDL